MYDIYKGYPDVRYTTCGMWERVHLVKFDKLFPLVLSNKATRVEPPDFDPVSDENVGCHGIGRIRRKCKGVKGNTGKRVQKVGLNGTWHVTTFRTAWMIYGRTGAIES